jgi:hypothetical protein
MELGRWGGIAHGKITGENRGRKTHAKFVYETPQPLHRLAVKGSQWYAKACKQPKSRGDAVCGKRQKGSFYVTKRRRPLRYIKNEGASGDMYENKEGEQKPCANLQNRQGRRSIPSI